LPRSLAVWRSGLRVKFIGSIPITAFFMEYCIILHEILNFTHVVKIKIDMVVIL
jgi:hypothetical protein